MYLPRLRAVHCFHFAHLSGGGQMNMTIRVEEYEEQKLPKRRKKMQKKQTEINEAHGLKIVNGLSVSLSPMRCSLLTT